MIGQKITREQVKTITQGRENTQDYEMQRENNECTDTHENTRGVTIINQSTNERQVNTKCPTTDKGGKPTTGEGQESKRLMNMNRTQLN